MCQGTAMMEKINSPLSENNCLASLSVPVTSNVKNKMAAGKTMHNQPLREHGEAGKDVNPHERTGPGLGPLHRKKA